MDPCSEPATDQSLDATKSKSTMINTLFPRKGWCRSMVDWLGLAEGDGQRWITAAGGQVPA